VKTEDVATRQNLLSLKERLGALKAGVELLKGRRKALTKEFVSLVEECIEERATLARLLIKARRGLELARALNGEALTSLSHASKRKVTFEIKKKNVWGVNVPEFQQVPVVRQLEARGVSPLGERAGLVDVAKGFEYVVDRVLRMASCEVEYVVDRVLRMASCEVRANRMGEMIRSDTRKINAIDELILPALKGRVKYIERVLEEREREEVFRLKRYKGRRRKRDLELWTPSF
jgi:V/A-type H+-transporting ATPase subunit D